MSVVTGIECKLYRNTGTFGSPTWSEIPIAREVRVTKEKTEIDATTRGSGGYSRTTGGLKAITLEFDVVCDRGNTHLAAIDDAWFDDTVIEFLALDGATTDDGARGIRAECEVLNISEPQPLDDAVVRTVTVKTAPTANAPSKFVVEV